MGNGFGVGLVDKTVACGGRKSDRLPYHGFFRGQSYCPSGSPARPLDLTRASVGSNLYHLHVHNMQYRSMEWHETEEQKKPMSKPIAKRCSVANLNCEKGGKLGA